MAETGRGLPLFDVLADVETGASVGAGPIIQHQYDALATCIRWLVGCVLD